MSVGGGVERTHRNGTAPTASTLPPTDDGRLYVFTCDVTLTESGNKPSVSPTVLMAVDRQPLYCTMVIGCACGRGEYRIQQGEDRWRRTSIQTVACDECGKRLTMYLLQEGRP